MPSAEDSGDINFKLYEHVCANCPCIQCLHVRVAFHATSCLGIDHVLNLGAFAIPAEMLNALLGGQSSDSRVSMKLAPRARALIEYLVQGNSARYIQVLKQKDQLQGHGKSNQVLIQGRGEPRAREYKAQAHPRNPRLPCKDYTQFSCTAFLCNPAAKGNTSVQSRANHSRPLHSHHFMIHLQSYTGMQIHRILLNGILLSPHAMCEYGISLACHRLKCV